MNEILRKSTSVFEQKSREKNILQDVQELIKNNAKPEEIVGFFSQFFPDIYDQKVGVWEGYTLGEHTSMVLKQFEKYFSEAALPEGCSRSFFITALALHDIGKPRAVQEGNKALQRTYTNEMIEQHASTLGVTQKELEMMQSLFAADPIGAYLQKKAEGRSSEEEMQRCRQKSVEHIRASAEQASMSVQDFWQLLLVFYTVDAGSYTVDAGGKESLDFLFRFFPEKGKMIYSYRVAESIQELYKNLFFDTSHSESFDEELFFPEERVSSQHPVEAAAITRLPFSPIKDRDYFKRTAILPTLYDAQDPEAWFEYRRTQYAAALEGEENRYGWTQADCSLMEKAVAQYGKENKAYFLTALHMMGKECDIDFVEELEKKFHVDLEYVKIAVHLFQADACSRKIRKHISDNDNAQPTDLTDIQQLTTLLVRSLNEMSHYSIPAQHATHSSAIENIEKTGQLVKSNRLDDYEGDGVYCGLFGSYDWWHEEKYQFLVPLADAHVTMNITRNGYPQAMCNMLGDSIIIRDPELPVRSRGMLQWRMMSEMQEDIPTWKVDLFCHALDISRDAISIEKDVLGFPCMILHEDIPPIMWSGLCRALSIAHCIPGSELDRFKIGKKAIPYDSLLSKSDVLESKLPTVVDMNDPTFWIHSDDSSDI